MPKICLKSLERNSEQHSKALKFFHTATDLEIIPGVVAVIQTFGDRINFHPHIHVLVTEGGTAPDGAFHRVCRFHDEVIQVNLFPSISSNPFFSCSHFCDISHYLHFNKNYQQVLRFS